MAMAENPSCEAIARAWRGEPAKREGAELLYRCPHPEGHKNGDSHPSLNINPKKNVWACFPCGASGTAWKLAAFLAGVDAGDKAAIKAWLKDKGLLNGAKRKAKADGRGLCVATYCTMKRKETPLPASCASSPVGTVRKKTLRGNGGRAASGHWGWAR